MASVTFERVRREAPFFALACERNALTLALAVGEPLTIFGRGAGRWPLADDRSRHGRRFRDCLASGRHRGGVTLPQFGAVKNPRC
jgi:hypothetical protein